MLIALLMLREWVIATPVVYFFAIFSLLVWAMWIVKVCISRAYRPWVKPYAVGTTVIIPVVDEPEDLFRDVLNRITQQNPDEVIVVINGKPNPGLERICADYPGVRAYHTPIPGKRNALKVGIDHAHYEIAVLVDSDTIWTDDNDGTLVELVKPFRDPAIGGVTTRQRILSPQRSFLTRWADWLENTRGLYSFPTQSVLGQVGCLPGRTIAFRTQILRDVMHDFMHQKFLGVFLEVSDDRTLTNLTLKAGYKTVYQHTSICYTDAPLELTKLYKQQLRWARGSQYNTLRMLPWYLGHAPLLAFFFLADIALPFLLLGAIGGWIYRSVTATGVNFYQPILEANPGARGYLLVAVLAVIASWASMLIRQFRHLNEVPSDTWRMPLYILFSSAFLMPIRVLGFFRMAHVAAWGTRKGAYTRAVAAIPEQRPQVMQLNGARVPAAASATPIPTLTYDTGAPVLLHSVVTLPQAPLPHIEVQSIEVQRPRRFNPLAGVPYLIGAAVLAAEAAITVLAL